MSNWVPGPIRVTNTFMLTHLHVKLSTQTHQHVKFPYLDIKLDILIVMSDSLTWTHPHIKLSTWTHPYFKFPYHDPSSYQILLPWPIRMSNWVPGHISTLNSLILTHLHDKSLYVDPSPCQIEYSDTSACQISLSWPIRISNWVPGHIDQIPLSGPIPYVKLSTWTHPHVKSIYVDPIHAHHRKAPPFSQAINKFKLFYSPPGCSIRFSVTSRY